MGLAFGVNLIGSRRATGLISFCTCTTAIADCYSKNITAYLGILGKKTIL